MRLGVRDGGRVRLREEKAGPVTWVGGALENRGWGWGLGEGGWDVSGEEIEGPD